MKKHKKLFSALVVAAAVAFGIVIGASASGTLQEIKAYLNGGITVTLDGEAQVFTNAQGVRVYPITYEGTTYLPVRAIAGLVGLEVEWDQATQTVKLGQSKGVDLIDTLKAYDLSSTVAGVNGNTVQVQSSEKKTQEISGVSCSHWVCLWQSRYNDQGTICKASFNVQGKYETLTFQYYSNSDVTLRVLGDNDSVLFEKTITGGQVAETATVPLLKTTQLTFQIEKPNGEWNEIAAYIFDAYLE